MQIKTIERNIFEKLTEWVGSITDENFRKSLKSNILVSGGSITSMLLNEPINDYDIYIKDRNVLVELVKYYIKPFGSDVEILYGELKKDYLRDFKEEGVDEDFVFAYKISVNNLKENQVKLWMLNKTGGLKVNNEVKEGMKYVPKFFSPNAISLSDQIQIVIRFHGDNEAIHKTFDFIHATNYFTFEDGLVTNKAALESILTKQLKYQGSQYPLTSVIRMKKFLKRNWNINAGEILKMLFQVSELNLKDPYVLEEQLIGVDIAYFGKIISILRGVEQNKLTSAYLNTIIDRVFNNFDDETTEVE